MSGNNDYEKLQLSKQDLRYLYGQILNNTTSKLDLHLPTSNNDPLKTKVANLLDDFIIDAFEMAKQSIMIDGYDMSGRKNPKPISELLSLKSKEKIEPFDFELNAQLRDVLEHVEQETIQVSKLRRELPSRARETYDNLISNTDKDVSTILAELDSELQQELHNDDDDETGKDDLSSMPRIDSIVEDYQQAFLILNNLKRKIPEQKSELDKLDETIQLLETAYRRQQSESGL
ncbi:DEHA2D10010p [Debaryomyces hansenii CBS767]|uniref:DEHA2D10010p n=1 Tax=Debaryomyces hansenii (strain ATCC 36239 / CBS 767 / BCRC 21394 / JCM 1990 / NBRC 0083 / IGC 2968) TaxID=284592 RepID=Q6BSC0_DEBHA|nr:DEHA2D10010p [Debaryomyces hansenii CBS767]CAG87054.2 DEHA2D10010p [Debaryomyces hansenii CBS767]|eukprot:XP_458900.2 DEHA2D10010p [Debaryomyces hansenii CBS767]